MLLLFVIERIRVQRKNKNSISPSLHLNSTPKLKTQTQPQFFFFSSRRRRRLDAPDLPRVLLDRPVRREEPAAGRHQDRPARPLVGVAVARVGLGLRDAVRREVVGDEEPVVALGHVGDVVDELLEVLAVAELARGDGFQGLEEGRVVVGEVLALLAEPGDGVGVDAEDEEVLGPGFLLFLFYLLLSLLFKRQNERDDFKARV